MGYTIEATREAAIDPAEIFALYMDPATWAAWGHNVRWAPVWTVRSSRAGRSTCSRNIP